MLGQGGQGGQGPRIDDRVQSLSCPYCEANFTGQHGKSNRTRHLKYKHSSSPSDPSLQCEQCHQWFNRTDAKKVHLRRAHQQEQNPEIGNRSIEYNQDRDISIIAKDSGSYMIESTALIVNKIRNESPSTAMFQPQVLSVDPFTSHGASMSPFIQRPDTVSILRILHYSLSPLQFGLIFENLHYVIKDMMTSLPYDTFACGFVSALIKLNALVEAENFHHCYSVKTSYVSCHTQGCSRFANGEQSPCSVNSTPSFSNSQDATSTIPSNTEIGVSVDPNRTRITSNVRVPPLDKTSRCFACPVEKYYQSHGQPSPCDYAGAQSMWYIAQHLKSPVHRYRLLNLCRECWEYYLDSECMNSHGQKLVQPRGIAQENQWIDLFQKLYPSATSVPYPYVDELGGPTGLPSSNSANTSNIHSSFSMGTSQEHQISPSPISQGRRRWPSSPPQDPGQSQALTPNREVSETAAMDTLLQILSSSIYQASDLFSSCVYRLLGEYGPLTPEQTHEIRELLLERVSATCELLLENAPGPSEQVQHPEPELLEPSSSTELQAQYTKDSEGDFGEIRVIFPSSSTETQSQYVHRPTSTQPTYDHSDYVPRSEQQPR
ncbi:hypothetical protein CC78DRAFT_577365 [Lojkania enalia]|uniref:C2H2-type domain-containing protein n=1 Tax=Lojkania enalia TaxID=147567 RepID=A0A9P4N2E2_9PLEO|nr:hypothetical protein CC78DRAFT_577365 [Didymosphaeria enalia]